jgi:23S rRNA (cytosine1962-C5)-methyltransferase
MSILSIILKTEKASKIIFNKHPWIFSGALAKDPINIKPGTIIQVVDETSAFVCQAVFNPKSNIVLRILSWNQQVLSDSWFKNHIKNISVQKEKLLGITDFVESKKNYRVVYSDADGIPGLIIDRYGKNFVIQLETLFSDIRRKLWIEVIKELWSPDNIYERSDVDARKKDGLAGLPAGLVYGPGNCSDILIEEDGLKMIVDVVSGQKTGYFLDLRTARRKIELLCKSFRITNLQNYFAYTGSFGIYAARAGVKKIEHIEISKKSNEIALRNFQINKIDKSIEIKTENSFDHIIKTEDNSIDAIILDPPSFAKSHDKLDNATEGYERINHLALKKLKSGGLLFTFCCSSFVDQELFRKILFRSAALASAKIKVIDIVGHDFDHAWPLTFPEARYLQGWFLFKEYDR